jgi:SLOG in TRPM, prokaryote/SMODS and SLOG-associating 2TM effector domain 1/Protein of unknown function (DUF4231)
MVRDDSDPTRILGELGLQASQGRPVIAVFGGADSLTNEARGYATAVVGPAITRAARTTGATIVDGGTAAGVMSIVGEAVAKRAKDRPVLLGVAPRDLVSLPDAPAAERVPLEPNHSHFVLIPGSKWGAETEPLLRLAEALAAGSPVVAVLVGGGAIAKLETLGAVRRSWSLLVAEQTGSLAELVATRRRALRPSPQGWTRRLFVRARGQAREHEAQSGDPQLDEIVAADGIRLFSSSDGSEFARELAWELQHQEVLKGAWRTFASYDELARSARTTFSRFQATILLVGIGGTFFALLDDSVDFGGRFGDVVHWAVVAAPILVSLLIAVAVRIGFGKRWVLLRGAAEALKSEIFRCRTQTGVYADDALAREGLTRDEALAARLNALDERLMHTDASSGPLTPYGGPLPPQMYGASATDDGLSPLDADGYLLLRVGDQLNYFHPRVVELARRLRLLQLLALAVGAAGTLLAAAGFEIWIGLTTSIAAATVAYLGYLQVEPTLVSYNQAAGRLEGLQRLWAAQPAEKHDFEWLVREGEGVLATELSGWVQQMNQAIEEAARRAEPPTETSGGDSSRPGGSGKGANGRDALTDGA